MKDPLAGKTSYCLRHTFATICQQYVRPDIVDIWMGDSPTRLVGRVYTHFPDNFMLENMLFIPHIYCWIPIIKLLTLQIHSVILPLKISFNNLPNIFLVPLPLGEKSWIYHHRNQLNPNFISSLNDLSLFK